MNYVPKVSKIKKIINFVRSKNFILLLIIFIALILRLNALTYLGSMPTPFLSAEGTPINTALRLLGDRSLNVNIPSNNYQPFLIYTNMILYAFVFVISLLLGIFYNIEEMKIFFILDRSILVLLSRIFIGLLSTASVYYLYKATKKLFNETIGLITVFFFAIELVYVATSHTATIWVPTIFFLILSFGQAVEVLKTSRPRAYFLSTLFAVLAYASHLIGGIAIIPLIVAHFLKQKKITKGLVFSGIFFVFSIILLFFIDRMQILWEFDTKSFVVEACFLDYGHYYDTYLDSLVYPIKFILNFHPLFAILSIASIVFLIIYKKHEELLLILSVPVFYYLYIGPLTSTGCHTRFFTIFMPFLMMLAAYAIVQFIDLINIKSIYFKKLCIFIVTILFATPSLLIVFSWSWAINQGSAYESAQQWIYKNLPSDSKILVNQLGGPIFLEQNNEYLIFAKDTFGEDALTQRQKIILNLLPEEQPKPAYFVVNTDLVPKNEWEDVFGNYQFDYYIDYYISFAENYNMPKYDNRELIKSFGSNYETGVGDLINEIHKPFMLLFGNKIESYKINIYKISN